MIQFIIGRTLLNTLNDSSRKNLPKIDLTANFFPVKVSKFQNHSQRRFFDWQFL